MRSEGRSIRHELALNAGESTGRINTLLIVAEARSFISRAWWLGVFAGLANMVTMLSVNFLGDALRDIFDVRETKIFGRALR